MPDYSSLEAIDYWPDQIILICLYTVIALVSFVLNSVTIAVLLKYDKIYSELNVYLINQCVSDILMSLLCIPFTYTNFILNRWIFPEFLCPLANFAQICSVLVSIWNLTVIGIERYLVIVNQRNRKNPSKYFLKISIQKKVLLISVIWLFAICSSCVQFVYTRVVPVSYGNHTVLFECRENIPEKYSKMYTIYLFMNAFVVPSLILAYVYTMIGYRVWKHIAPWNQQHQQLSSHHKHMINVAKMMLLNVFLFFLCWTPLHIFTLLAIFVDTFLQISSAQDYDLLVYGYLVCHLLAMSHSFVNPLVYCCISRKFSQNFCILTHRFFLRLPNCFPRFRKRQSSSVTVVLMTQPTPSLTHW